MDASIIPVEWKKFLATLQTKFPSAIIAGGALRDTIIDNPVKDVDIFIEDIDMDGELDLDEIAALFGVKAIDDEEQSDRDFARFSHDIKTFKREAQDKYMKVDVAYINQETGGKRALLESFVNYIIDVSFNGMMYQLIFVEADPVAYVYKDFDFGICKVYFDGFDLVVSEEFWYDYNNRQITIAGKFAPGQMHHTLFTHRPNIMKKFPNWKFVIDDLALRELHEMPPSYQKLSALVPEQPPTAEGKACEYIVSDGYGGMLKITKSPGEPVRSEPIKVSTFEDAMAIVNHMEAKENAKIDDDFMEHLSWTPASTASSNAAPTTFGPQQMKDLMSIIKKTEDIYGGYKDDWSRQYETSHEDKYQFFKTPKEINSHFDAEYGNLERWAIDTKVSNQLFHDMLKNIEADHEYELNKFHNN